MFRTSFIVLLFAFLVVGCSKNGGDQCPAPPPPEPAFRLELTADHGPLPPGTVLQITYGGNQSESYVLGEANPGNVDVCCRPALPMPEGTLPSVSCAAPDASASKDAGASDGGGILALDCELWTNGTAGVTVTGPGFPELDQVLEAKQRADNCGVETQDERIVLLHADAGH